MKPLDQVRNVRAGQNRKTPGLIEQEEVFLRHYALIPEMRPMLRIVRRFRKLVVGYSKHHPERIKVQADLIAARRKTKLTLLSRNGTASADARYKLPQPERYIIKICIDGNHGKC